MARRARTPYLEVNWDAVLQDIVSLELSTSDIMEKYNVSKKNLFHYCDEMGFNIDKRNERLRKAKQLKRILNIIGTRMEEFKKDAAGNTLTIPALLTKYGIKDSDLNRILEHVGVDPVKRRKAIDARKHPRNHAAKDTGTNIPETMTGDGRSLAWLSKPWLLAA